MDKTVIIVIDAPISLSITIDKLKLFYEWNS